MPIASAVQVCDARNDAMLPAVDLQKKRLHNPRVMYTDALRNATHTHKTKARSLQNGLCYIGFEIY